MSPAVSPLLGPVCADGSTSVKLRQLRSLDLIKEADMSVGRSVSAYGATIIISLKDTYGDHLAEAEPEQQRQVAANQTELDRKQKVAEELECVRRKSGERGLKKTKPSVSMSPTAICPEHIVSDGLLDPRCVAAATTSPAVTPRRRSVSLETIQETDTHERRIFSK